MAKINAREARIFVDNFNLSTGLNNVTQAAEQEELDVTPFEGSSGFRQFISGFRGGELTLDGFFDFTTDSTAPDNNRTDNVFDNLFGATNNPVVTYTPKGGSIGNNAVLTKGVETAYEVGASIGDAISVSASLRNDDGPDYGNLLHEHSTEGSSGASTSVQHNTTDGTTNGSVGHLHVTSYTTGGTNTGIVVNIQHSSDNATWADLITFSTFTNSTHERVSSTADVKEFVREERSQFDAGGATFVVSFARR